VTRKSIQTNGPVISCDVCGRTLLPGERADVFLHGGARRQVCDLCTARAAHEGWIREGLDDATVHSRHDGRRRVSLLQRLRGRRHEPERLPEPDPAPAEPSYEHDPEWDYDPGAVAAEEAVAAPRAAVEPQPEPEWSPTPAPPRYALREPREHHERPAAPREQRSVHAVPTNADLKMARAVDIFNGSAHRRTVSGVARSLGAPIVAVRPSATEGSVVTIVVAWELSWYRFEVDLADEASGVRVTSQGAELDELEADEREPNASADESGTLHLAAGRA
jgi:hypothetical protein